MSAETRQENMAASSVVVIQTAALAPSPGSGACGRRLEPPQGIEEEDELRPAYDVATKAAVAEASSSSSCARDLRIDRRDRVGRQQHEADVCSRLAADGDAMLPVAGSGPVMFA